MVLNGMFLLLRIEITRQIPRRLLMAPNVLPALFWSHSQTGETPSALPKHEEETNGHTRCN